MSTQRSYDSTSDAAASTEDGDQIRSHHVTSGVSVQAGPAEPAPAHRAGRLDAQELLRPGQIWSDVQAETRPTLTQLEWAENEIEAAQQRHPAAADQLHHALALLVPTQQLMTTEFVYRSHCRELLDRLAGGGDTREATSAEIAVACSQVSMVLPLGTAGAALYMRAWRRAFPSQPAFDPAVHEHYEYVAGDNTERLESLVRRQLRQPGRTVDGTVCPGRHFGQLHPDCRYAAGGC